MKMDMHAIFNFSSVAYVALRYRCLIFVLFSTTFATDRSFASIYTANDPRYTVADPRYTISALHILPSHTFEYRAREQWKKITLAVLLTNECAARMYLACAARRACTWHAFSKKLIAPSLITLVDLRSIVEIFEDNGRSLKRFSS